MTKKLYLLFALLALTSLSGQLFSQGYFPFPEDNAIWNLKYVDYWHNQHEIRFGIIGEEQIQNKTYKKIYQLADTTLVNSGATYIGGLREEDKRIYLLLGYGGEQLLYDFNLVVGDSIKYNFGGLYSYYDENFDFFQTTDTFYRKVTSIDTITLLDGSHRRHYYLEGNGLNLDDEWIEGIGSSIWVGLFNPIVNDIYTNGDYWRPLCFKHNDEVIFLENSDCEQCFCTISSNIDAVKVEDQYTQPFPNPTNDVVTFNLNSENSNIETVYKISILDINNKTLKEVLNNSDNIELNISDLKQGIYFYKVSKNDLLIQTGKLIKE